jgi:tungstate transport system ATP-binding protein
VPGRERRARIAEALALVGLEGFERRAARTLSGGEQQRLALARAWALRPQLLLLDEPTASLDPAATRRVEAILADLRARGVTIVMSTHDLGQARRLAQDVLFLWGGRLVEAAPASRFFAEPESREARAFLVGELPD